MLFLQSASFEMYKSGACLQWNTTRHFENAGKGVKNWT